MRATFLRVYASYYCPNCGDYRLIELSGGDYGCPFCKRRHAFFELLRINEAACEPARSLTGKVIGHPFGVSWETRSKALNKLVRLEVERRGGIYWKDRLSGKYSPALAEALKEKNDE